MTVRFDFLLNRNKSNNFNALKGTLTKASIVDISLKFTKI